MQAQNPIILRDVAVILRDGSSPTRKVFTLKFREGDLSLGGLRPNHREVMVFESRGEQYAVRETAETGVDIAFSAHSVSWTDADEATLRDVALRSGTWASAKSTLPAGQGDAWMLEVEIQAARRGLAGTATGKLVCKYVSDIVLDWKEGNPSSFAFKGKALILGDADALAWTEEVA